MNDTAPQSAIREWRTHLAFPARAAGLVAATVILAVIGPFETIEIMRLLPRLAYWAVIVVLCYSAGYFANQLATRWAGPDGSLWRRLAIAVPLTSLGVLVIIYLLNGLAIAHWATGTELAILAGNVIVISATITVALYVAHHGQAAPTATAPPALLDRIPFDKHGPLISISVEDHYVRIRTTNGEDMVLLRLADAMREVGDTAGLQVHRSHWIALGQVTAATRKGDGAVLSMSQGPDIPVSRANIANIKEAGLLPRS